MENFEYEVLEDKSIKIVKCDLRGEKVIIPKIIDNHLVTALGEKLFKGNCLIKTIILPETINLIEGECFYSCISLREINLPESLLSIGEECFKKCYSLEKIVIPHYISFLPYSLFEYCYNLKNIEIKGMVNFIDSICFKHCTSLKEIDICGVQLNCAPGIFSTCTSLEKVRLGVVKELDMSTFLNDTNLKEIHAIFLPDSVVDDNFFFEVYCKPKIYIGEEFPLELKTIVENNDLEVIKEVPNVKKEF